MHFTHDNLFQNTKRICLVIVHTNIIDFLGSMAGLAMNLAKEAVLQIMEGLVEKGVFAEKDITCFFFGTYSHGIRFSDYPNMLLTNGEIRKYFDKINASGGNFNSIFQCNFI